MEKVYKTNLQWRDLLPDDVYYITREAGTERPYTGRYNDFYEVGDYHCACCDALLFTHQTKFESHCGWPAFFAEAQDGATVRILDESHGMVREEVRCSCCDAHLGHVFPDGPPPTKERYCINSLAMKFVKQD